MQYHGGDFSRPRAWRPSPGALVAEMIVEHTGQTMHHLHAAIDMPEPVAP